jgi:hypothetical protein
MYWQWNECFYYELEIFVLYESDDDTPEWEKNNSWADKHSLLHALCMGNILSILSHENSSENNQKFLHKNMIASFYINLHQILNWEFPIKFGLEKKNKTKLFATKFNQIKSRQDNCAWGYHFVNV